MSKDTLISETGIIQQTERFGVEDKLEESNEQFKSKSYQKDDILLQLIQAQQTQKKKLLDKK